MKSLADFKRLLVKVAEFEFTHLKPMRYKNADGDIITPEIETVSRIVEIVQTNSVGFKRPDGVVSWLQYPKAKECRFEDNSIIIMEDGEDLLKYKLKQ